jgi:hypothetical protein
VIEATAYHEAGHMVAAWRMRVKIRKATIVPAEDYEGCVHHESPLRGIKLDVDGSDRAEIKANKMVLICLAGAAAQRHYNPESLDDSVRRWHGKSDFDIALDLAMRLACDNKVADAYLKWMQLRAEALITSNWKFVVAFANRLLERKTLEYSEIGALISEAISLAGRT